MNILQNFFFLVPQKNEHYMDLKASGVIRFQFNSPLKKQSIF